MADVAFQTIQTNGISMRIAEAGTGPLVLLIHGWPESWYSWRHQVTALADAGYHVVAPDMRGYGDTDAPADPALYRIDILAADVVGIIDHFGADKATIVGHDWGSLVVWFTSLYYPERLNGVVGMSVPHSPRGPVPPVEGWRKAMGENFFYILYHNEPVGVAEAEYDSNPRGLISMLYTSPGTPHHPPTITDPKRSAGGWIGRIGAPLARPGWLTEADLDYYTNEFKRAGFRGGVNYYRNFDSNWHLVADLDHVVRVPAAFISGAADGVIGGADQDALTKAMAPVVADLRSVTLIPGVGHWVQQEAPAPPNEAILEFLGAVNAD